MGAPSRVPECHMDPCGYIRGGRTVDIVRLRTKIHGVCSCVCLFVLYGLGGRLRDKSERGQ
jgi:hypothetical protein